jgi:Zn finger protein HypA/HybF involved in hydrogenase expression
MPLSLICNNSYTDDKGKSRKCGQIEPFMDPKTEQVFCPLCQQEMTQINHFAKVTLKNLRQFRQKPQIPFCVKCQNCNQEAQPKIEKEDVVCPKCNKPHTHLSEPFKLMLKDKLKTVNKDV